MDMRLALWSPALATGLPEIGAAPEKLKPERKRLGAARSVAAGESSVQRELENAMPSLSERVESRAGAAPASTLVFSAVTLLAAAQAQLKSRASPWCMAFWCSQRSVMSE